MIDDEAPAIDVVFGLAGTSVPADYAYGLWRAAVRWLPWFETEAGAGIHRLRTAPTGYGAALLARRSKLTLRVPQSRLDGALALAGKTLAIDDSRLVVGSGSARPIFPWATLKAELVAAGAQDDGEFQDAVAQWLSVRGVACGFISGQRRTVCAGEREIVGFSVVLHGLAPAASMRMQCEGMGGDRGLGCGLFVPHKSIAAVV